ncbi:methylated-DNA--protein-cysteine methyltransferase isoform X2 [Motacilla alba alba]|uniref:methylated-DNA--protein-cysteine methyltransferase isoform X2 n=1 Tax=Motacilla alba alba TaxID=1094192 RepID=UPI0018D5502D|nr:methylated-DNA--protein-cysteine methyltransferase isoform X2 [Motacilla alba alba]
MRLLPSGRAESSVACEVCEGAEEMPEPLQQCTAWLRAYFCEPATTGTLPVPAFHHPLLQRDSFTRQVLWTLLNDVKFGEAVSYKQLAELAGNSRAARAVGGAMRSNPIPILIPCHRVIRSSGDSGSYGGGHLMKEWLLSHEKLQKEKLARAAPRPVTSSQSAPQNPGKWVLCEYEPPEAEISSMGIVNCNMEILIFLCVLSYFHGCLFRKAIAAPQKIIVWQCFS